MPSMRTTLSTRFPCSKLRCIKLYGVGQKFPPPDLLPNELLYVDVDEEMLEGRRLILNRILVPPLPLELASEPNGLI